MYERNILNIYHLSSCGALDRPPTLCGSHFSSPENEDNNSYIAGLEFLVYRIHSSNDTYFFNSKD